MRLFLLLFVASIASAQTLFEVVPPERADFNYPPPPREGAPGFFPIAEDGAAKCVIVHPADATSGAQAAVRALQRYLNLATAARIALLSYNTAIPADMAIIHVGDTILGRKTDLDLPELRYGQVRFPNLRGYLV